ncbi:MAG: lysophospholipid acyltransferase family protein [Burkholderiaceae bacterium]|nr:lysophospholipid acyltransferase family protein [Burkholderiaceae bacterium]
MSESVQTCPFLFNGALAHTLFGRLEPLLERASGLRQLQTAYDALPRGLSVDEFLAASLDWLGVETAVAPCELAHIPAQGGAVLVANHPHGVIDGLALATLLRQVRPDVRFLANSLLVRVPEVASMFISVDPFGGAGAEQRNRGPLRQAIRWVEQGGLLVVFPAGEVSHLQLRRGAVTDPDWHSAVARIITRTGAPVIPAFIPGHNGLGFQLAGLLHPRLRTALLARELLNKSGRRLNIHFGAPIQPVRLDGLGANQLLSFLRLRCYGLGEDQRARDGSKVLRTQAVAMSQDASLLDDEVSALDSRACLVESGDLQVYCARSELIPHVLQEIGRLREVTFRATGEGTGQAVDIDLYDNYYQHLFVWNRVKRELVGAYRLGHVDHILQRYGSKGLYTQSLFRFNRGLLSQLGPALELGRSFIRPEYQRSYQPLLLLWKGIGAYVAANPRYKVLFGPVSISADYSTASRQLLVDFLRANNLATELARRVRPRRPFKGLTRRGCQALTVIQQAEQISRLLEQMEGDGKGMPVLLRQYLKLGGKVLGFNVDAAFSNVLDGLIMVDLTQTDPAVLARYMGRDASAKFLAQHAEAPATRIAS